MTTSRSIYDLEVPSELGGGSIQRPLAETVVPSGYTAQPRQTLSLAPEKITRTVRVLDDQGTPLPGAHVYFDNSSGTTTNFNGTASITGEPDREVYVSYIGFSPSGYTLRNLPSTVKLTPGESLDEVVITAPAKAAKTDSKVPKYLFPAIGGVALLLILMSMGSPAPKEVTL